MALFSTDIGTRHPLLVQIVRFALVGALGTGVTALVFLVLRLGLDPVPANLVAIVASTIVSTEVNRRFTFGGAAVHHWRQYVQNGGTVLFYACYSSAVLLLVDMLVPDPGPVLEATAVAAASLLGGAARFLVMRFWVLREHHVPADRRKVVAGDRG